MIVRGGDICPPTALSMTTNTKPSRPSSSSLPATLSSYSLSQTLMMSRDLTTPSILEDLAAIDMSSEATIPAFAEVLHDIRHDHLRARTAGINAPAECGRSTALDGLIQEFEFFLQRARFGTEPASASCYSAHTSVAHPRDYSPSGPMPVAPLNQVLPVEKRCSSEPKHGVPQREDREISQVTQVLFDTTQTFLLKVVVHVGLRIVS